MRSACWHLATTDPQLHEEIRVLARQGSDAAIIALAPFVETNAEDRSIVLQQIRESQRNGRESTFRSAVRVLAAEATSHPEIKQYFVNQFRTETNAEKLLRLVESTGHLAVRDPEMLTELRKMLSRKGTSEKEIELRETIIAIILNRHPADADASLALKEHLKRTLSSFEDLPFRVPKVFDLAQSYVGRVPGLDRVVKDGMDEVIQMLNERPKGGFINDIALRQLADLYLETAKETKRLDVHQLTRFLDAVGFGDRREYAWTAIIMQADELPESAQHLVRAAIDNLDSVSVGGGIAQGEPLSSAAMAVIRRDLEKGGPAYEHALSLLTNYGDHSSEAIELIRAQLNNPRSSFTQRSSQYPTGGRSGSTGSTGWH